jgi:hypothetical protein
LRGDASESNEAPGSVPVQCPKPRPAPGPGPPAHSI